MSSARYKLAAAKDARERARSHLRMALSYVAAMRAVREDPFLSETDRTLRMIQLGDLVFSYRRMARDARAHERRLIEDAAGAAEARVA